MEGHCVTGAIPPACIIPQRLAMASPGAATGSEWLRLLYGGQIENDPLDSELLPAMQLRSRVLAVRHVKQGEAVGYGARWVAEKDSKIATIPWAMAMAIPWLLQTARL